MSSSIPKRALVCAFFALVSYAASGAQSRSELTCLAGEERDALKEAPLGARRVKKHVLEVISKERTQRFVDIPPHDDWLDGEHWRYCGYNAQAKAHLIELVDHGRRSGIVLLNETGTLVPAGHTIVFAPDGNRFLAIEQQPGVDGEEWSLRDTAGRKIWEGYTLIFANVNGKETEEALYGFPQWTEQGELTAILICRSSELRPAITLVRASSGNWSWRRHGKC